jgi:hypothetical protein
MIKTNEKEVQEDMLHLLTGRRRRRGDLNISENIVKCRDWENRIATP